MPFDFLIPYLIAMCLISAPFSVRIIWKQMAEQDGNYYRDDYGSSSYKMTFTRARVMWHIVFAILPGFSTAIVVSHLFSLVSDWLDTPYKFKK